MLPALLGFPVRRDHSLLTAPLHLIWPRVAWAGFKGHGGVRGWCRWTWCAPSSPCWSLWRCPRTPRRPWTVRADVGSDSGASSHLWGLSPSRCRGLMCLGPTRPRLPPTSRPSAGWRCVSGSSRWGAPAPPEGGCPRRAHIWPPAHPGETGRTWTWTDAEVFPSVWTGFTSTLMLKPLRVTLPAKPVVSGRVSNLGGRKVTRSFWNKRPFGGLNLWVTLLPGQSCWLGKQPWGFSSACPGPPGGVSLWCRGVYSGPTAHKTLPATFVPWRRGFLFSHLVKRGAQDDGQQQQSDRRHRHDEPQLSHQQLTPLTSLRLLSEPFSPSRRSRTGWSCRL